MVSSGATGAPCLLLALVVLASAAACSIYDESLLEDGQGGDGVGAAGATGGNATQTGGTGGVPTCTAADECPGTDDECRHRTCVDGACGFENAPAGTPLRRQTPGDCVELACDGMGAVTSNPQGSDVEDDGFQCTSDTCDAGIPQHDPEPEGTRCTQGGKLCSAEGTCVECLSNADCPSGMCSEAMTCGEVPCGDHLLISEVRSRGVAGAADEFIELYNPTAAPVLLDPSWKIQSRSTSGMSYTDRWIGKGTISIPAKGHFLIVGSAYAQPTTGDDTLLSGVTDASSLRLMHSNVTVDVVCYYFNATTLDTLQTGVGYECEGTPVSNLPHNDGTSPSSNSDASIERKPGGALGNCIDTGNSAADWTGLGPAQPQNVSSPAT